MLSLKADRVAVYAQHEVDDAIAAAVAGKADAADVYAKADLYSKAEIDALTQLLYTKDEVDGLTYTETEIDAMFGEVYSKPEVEALLVDERIWLATVAPNGDEIGSGFTSMRLGAGIYRVTFQLSAHDFPSTSDPIFTALPRCANGTAANTATFKNLLAGEVNSVQLEVETRNTAGALVDCGLHLMMRMS